MFYGPATLTLRLAFMAILTITGVSPSGDVARAAPAAAPRKPTSWKTAAATKLWAPKKSERSSDRSDRSSERLEKPERTSERTPEKAAGRSAERPVERSRSRSADRIAREEELLLRPRTPQPAPPPRPARRIRMEQPAAEEGDAGGGGDDEADDEDKPTISKRHKSDDDDEDGEPSLPSIAPHALALGVGSSFMHRSFSYDTPLQPDNGFRFGYAITAESYPFQLANPGWYDAIGIGFRYANELIGSAGVHDPGNDSLIIYPVKQARWGFDLRYALALGTHLVLVPALGYDELSVDLDRPAPVAPSMCPAGSPLPCFADVSASHLTADVYARFAVTPAFGLSLALGYARGLSVSRASGQLAAEAPAASNGIHVEPAASLMLGDYFALQAAVPILRYSYAFSARGAAAYNSATETYWGLVLGIAALVY
jgi:hypothetical protein